MSTSTAGMACLHTGAVSHQVCVLVDHCMRHVYANKYFCRSFSIYWLFPGTVCCGHVALGARNDSCQMFAFSGCDHGRRMWSHSHTVLLQALYLKMYEKPGKFCRLYAASQESSGFPFCSVFCGATQTYSSHFVSMPVNRTPTICRNTRAATFSPCCLQLRRSPMSVSTTPGSCTLCPHQA